MATMAKSPQQLAKVKRMIKIFFQISDELAQEKLQEINEIINDAAKYSKDGNEREMKKNLQKFFNLVAFKPGISVNLLNQGMRSLVMIQKNPGLCEAVCAPIIQQLVKKFPTLSGIGIDEKSIQLYLKALQNGEEKLKHIRLMVVGMFKVGKTCLVRRLRGEPIHDVKETTGIDVSVKTCVMNDDGSWTNQTEEESKNTNWDAKLAGVTIKPNTTEPGDSKPRTEQTTPVVPVYKPKPTEPKPAAPAPTPENEPEKPTPATHQAPATPIEKWRTAFEDLGKSEKGKKYIATVRNAPQKKKVAGIKPTVSIWDFAGQTVYYTTHHFFLSSRSIYLLVMDISKDLDKEIDETDSDSDSDSEMYLPLKGCMKKKYTCRDAFKFWVTSIYTYTHYKTGKGYEPKIVLIGTHGDELKGSPQQKENYMMDYFEKARSDFEGTQMSSLFYDKYFLVSCTDDEDKVFEDLKKNITQIAKGQSYWEEKTPATWIPLSRYIEHQKHEKRQLIEFSEVARADGGNEYNLNDEPEIKLFLRIQHFHGIAIYFNAKDLDKTIILEPQWLIDKFKKFVSHKIPMTKEMRGNWIEYSNTGKLNRKLMEYIVRPTDEGEENESVNVIRYMEHLDVIAKPVSEEDADFVIVPCVLKQLTEQDYNEKIKHLVNVKEGKATFVLCFVFTNGFLPPSVYHRLLATYIKKKKIKRRGHELFIYNGFGAFELTSTQTLCIWFADFIIYARVILHDKKNDRLRTEQCISIRKELSDTITKILHLDQHDTAGTQEDTDKAFKENVLCETVFQNNRLKVLQSTTKFEWQAGLFEAEFMEPSRDCHCGDAMTNGHTIERELALRYWFEEPEYLKKISDWFKEEASIKETFLEDAPERRDLEALQIYVKEDEMKKLGELLKIDERASDIITSGKERHDKVIDIFHAWRNINVTSTNQELKEVLCTLKEFTNDTQAKH